MISSIKYQFFKANALFLNNVIYVKSLLNNIFFLGGELNNDFLPIFRKL